MRKVIIHLAGGDFSQAHFSTKTEAHEFIAAWVKRINQAYSTGNPKVLEVMLTHLSDDGGLTGAWMADKITGMYLAQSDPSPQERMAAAMEKHLDEGEDWKA